MKYLKLFESYIDKFYYSGDEFHFGYSDIEWFYKNYTAREKYTNTYDEVSWNSRWIYENYEDYKENYDTIFKEYEDFFNARIKQLVDIAGHFYYEKKSAINTFLSSKEIGDDDQWPFLIYVSATGDSGDEIGIMIHEDGKIEQFEGNEETNQETDSLVNVMLGIGDKEINVYGNHGEDLVWKMKEGNFLEKNLYVSPDKSYAESYWSLSENRLLFSCIVKLKYLKQESDVDWRVIENVPIKNFKIL